MKAIIVGLGVQGNKRKKFLGKDFVYSVDKFKKANFKSIYQVPLNKFDTVFVCVPDDQKLKIVNYCINNRVKLFFSSSHKHAPHIPFSSK